MIPLDAMMINLRCVMMICRFKQLSTAALTFKTHIKQQTEVLQSLNTHLSRLTALHIHMDFKESCYGEGDWCAIGTCSGLQQLSVKFRHPQKGYIPFCAGHLSALAPLKDTLQHLHIDADVADCEAHSIMDWSPLKDLKQLTYLSLVTGRGTSAVGSCTKLSVLQLQLYNPLHRLGESQSRRNCRRCMPCLCCSVGQPALMHPPYVNHHKCIIVHVIHHETGIATRALLAARGSIVQHS